MANESTTGGPLTATVGEQLAGKGHLDAVHEAEQAVAPRAGPGGGRRAGPAPSRAARGRAARLPWGAILAAGAGWILAKSIVRGLRRR